jgi:hypothetical protein
MAATLLTATALSRELRAPHSILVRALRSGTVAPDFIAGRIQLFKPQNVAAIADTLNKPKPSTR